jgi:anti-sigma regulatory factor (Ser/Thr protein kinase)
VSSLEIRAEPQELRRASAWLQERGERLAVAGDQIDPREVWLKEVLANLLEHGGTPVASQPIRLRLEGITPPAGAGVRLVISDAGVPFDPLVVSDKPLPASLDEASPGGLGLRLVRAYTDGMAYRVHEDRNELSIEMHWSPRS